MSAAAVVSGGTGLVGRFIVEALLADGHRVTVAGRRPPPDGFFSAPVAFAQATLEPGTASEALFEAADTFVHAAFDHLPGRYRGGEGEDPEGFRRRNLDGTLALFEAAERAGVRRAVFLSSRAVYGPWPEGTALSEEMAARPDTLYGRVKLDAEKALAAMTGGAGPAPASLRLTGVYGPAGPGREHKWTRLFADYLAGRPILPRAASEVHGRDAAAAVRLVLSVPDETFSGGVFDVSDIIVDRRDILALVQRATGCPHILPDAADKRAVNAMTSARLRALGWRPGGMPLLGKTVPDLLRRSC